MPKKKQPVRRRYDTDLTDTQCQLIAPLIPDAREGGSPQKATSRELVDVILYFLHADVAWLLWPHLRPWPTIYYSAYYNAALGGGRRLVNLHHTLVLRRPRVARSGILAVGGDLQQPVGPHCRRGSSENHHRS